MLKRKILKNSTHNRNTAHEQYDDIMAHSTSDMGQVSVIDTMSNYHSTAPNTCESIDHFKRFPA